MNKLYIKKPVMLTVPKKQLYLVLPYMGKMSALVKSGLARSLHKRLSSCKVRIVFKTSNRLRKNNNNNNNNNNNDSNNNKNHNGEMA